MDIVKYYLLPKSVVLKKKCEYVAVQNMYPTWIYMQFYFWWERCSNFILMTILQNLKTRRRHIVELLESFDSGNFTLNLVF